MRAAAATAGATPATPRPSAPPSGVDQLRVPGVDLLPLFTQARDAEAHLVARLEERRRLHPHADARRRAGRDEVAGPERHEAAAVRDELGDAEDHRARRSVLAALAVDVEPHREVLRVLDLVGGHHPRADRAERVAALALVPRAAALELVLALGDVVDDAVAGDELQRVGLVDVARLLADDDAELDLPVALERALRQHDGVVRADDRAGRLHEDDRLLRDRGAGLGGVVRVVEADADELAHAAPGRRDAAGARDRGQLRGVELGESAQV